MERAAMIANNRSLVRTPLISQFLLLTIATSLASCAMQAPRSTEGNTAVSDIGKTLEIAAGETYELPEGNLVIVLDELLMGDASKIVGRGGDREIVLYAKTLKLTGSSFSFEFLGFDGVEAGDAGGNAPEAEVILNRVRIENSSPDPIAIGTFIVRGGNGSTGAKGTAGAPGRNASCSSDATNGGNGGPGGTGGNGGDAAPFELAYRDVDGLSIVAKSIAGEPGEGGPGGDRGPGGRPIDCTLFKHGGGQWGAEGAKGSAGQSGKKGTVVINQATLGGLVTKTETGSEVLIQDD